MHSRAVHGACLGWAFSSEAKAGGAEGCRAPTCRRSDGHRRLGSPPEFSCFPSHHHPHLAMPPPPDPDSGEPSGQDQALSSM